jgi:hypothetical protein
LFGVGVVSRWQQARIQLLPERRDPTHVETVKHTGLDARPIVQWHQLFLL